MASEHPSRRGGTWSPRIARLLDVALLFGLLLVGLVVSASLSGALQSGSPMPTDVPPSGAYQSDAVGIVAEPAQGSLDEPGAIVFGDSSGPGNDPVSIRENFALGAFAWRATFLRPVEATPLTLVAQADDGTVTYRANVTLPAGSTFVVGDEPNITHLAARGPGVYTLTYLRGTETVATGTFILLL